MLRAVELSDGGITVSRVVADGFETVELPTPCVLTISNEFGDPRYPQLRQIMRAARKQVTEFTAADLGLDPSEVGAAGARVQMHALYQPTSDVEVEIIEGDTPEEKATGLVAKLREARII